MFHQPVPFITAIIFCFFFNLVNSLLPPEAILIYFFYFSWTEQSYHFCWRRAQAKSNFFFTKSCDKFTSLYDLYVCASFPLAPFLLYSFPGVSELRVHLYKFWLQWRPLPPAILMVLDGYPDGDTLLGLPDILAVIVVVVDNAVKNSCLIKFV